MKQEQPPRVETVLGEMHGLEGKDVQLWSMSLLIIVALTAGLLAFLLPNVMWNLATLKLESRYLRQLFFGLAILILLYNVYAVDLRRTLHHTREELVRQLLRAEAAESLTLVDPLTEVFNRRYLDRIIPQEVSRADRSAASVAFLMIDLDHFKSVNTRFGHQVGDRVLKALAALLNGSLRRSDIVIRYGGDEFVVVMPDTTEEQGRHTVERILREVHQWNRENPIPGYEMSVSCGLSAYKKGMNIEEALETADQQMYQDKKRPQSSA